MATKKTNAKDRKFIGKLEEYLRMKQEIKEMEEAAKAMEKELFADPEILPQTIMVDGVNFGLIKKMPTIAITTNMIVNAGLDIDRIIPVAAFSATLVKTVFGASGESAVKSTDAYNDELALKDVSYYYKKK